MLHRAVDSGHQVGELAPTPGVRPGIQIGDRLVQAIAQYRNDKGEYPDSLDRLIPGYLEEIPYTGMIAYPEFSYLKDRNDIQTKPGPYDCGSIARPGDQLRQIHLLALRDISRPDPGQLGRANR